MKESIAKAIRIISIPPIMIIFLITVLAVVKPVIFTDPVQIILSILFLGIFPIFAYPVYNLVAKYKEKEREQQRKLAFIFTLIGYTVNFVYAMICNLTPEYKLIASTYFLSIVILSFFNKCLKLKASGHACSFTGPIVLLIYLVNYMIIIPGAAFAIVVCWSSLHLKRHTLGQLLGGIVTCLISFFLSMFIFPL